HLEQPRRQPRRRAPQARRSRGSLPRDRPRSERDRGVAADARRHLPRPRRGGAEDGPRPRGAALPHGRPGPDPRGHPGRDPRAHRAEPRPRDHHVHRDLRTWNGPRRGAPVRPRGRRRLPLSSMAGARATEVAAIILAGGEGKRLYPLTRDRAKPAVPFAGRYRIIDFVLSNFVNSGIVDCDARRRVTGFREKPPVDHDGAGTRRGSMGLYVFNANVLVRAVVEDADRADSTHDFGRDLLPRLSERGRVHAYDFSTNT